MSGPAEGGCPLCLQQHSLERPGASTSTIRQLQLKREFAAASSHSGNAVTYQMPVSCSLAVAPNHGMRTHD